MRIVFSIALAMAVVLSSGCSYFTSRAPTPLEEPQALRQPPAERLDILGRFGDMTAARFETVAYTGLAQNSFTEVGADSDPDISPDGSMIVFASTRHSMAADIYMKRTDGRTVTRLTNDPAHDIQPAFSPDGRFIAFASDRTGNWDVYVMATDGRKPFQVTSSLSHDVHPSWSPDGAQLCYSQYNSRNGQWEIWVVEVANPANRRFVTFGLYPTWCPSPAVNRIAFQMARHRGTPLFSIWTVDLVDDEARYLTEVVPATASQAMISPEWDGTGMSLVYATIRMAVDPETGRVLDTPVERGDDIWLTSVDGASRIRLTGEQTSDWCPAWAPDGRVYFASNRGGADNIWSLKPVDVKLINATRVAPQRVGSGAPLPNHSGASPSTDAPSASANRADL